MATTDALTGLSNRRAFIDWATREVARCTRYGDQLCVVLLDVDHFKLINDRHGHAVGDAVLAAVSRLIGSIVRSCDVVARWGGEEFVIALPSTALDWGDVGRRPHPCGARAAPDRRSQPAKRDGHPQLWGGTARAGGSRRSTRRSRRPRDVRGKERGAQPSPVHDPARASASVGDASEYYAGRAAGPGERGVYSEKSRRVLSLILTAPRQPSRPRCERACATQPNFVTSLPT